MADSVDRPEISRIQDVYLRRDHSSWKKRYGIAEPGNVLRIEELHRQMQALLAARIGSELSEQRILDVGCGTGYWLRQFIQWGACPEHLFGLDLLGERIARAKASCPAGVHLDCRDACQLPFDDASFDMSLQATVFSSILDGEMKKLVAAEIIRVLKPGGCLLWYDYFVNNPRNCEARGVTRQEIGQLFSGCRISLQRITLAPPLGRLVARISPLGYYLLSGISILCTHYLGFIEKPDDTPRIR